jgi:cytoskeletal protein RodZ
MTAPLSSTSGTSPSIEPSPRKSDLSVTQVSAAALAALTAALLGSTTAGSVAAFALAMMVITGVENATGQTLSGGNTPTVSQFVGGEQRTSEPAPEVPAPETSTAPSQSPEPTSSPEATSTSGPQEPDSSTDAHPTETRAPTDARPTGTTDRVLPGIPLPAPTR